MVALSSRSRVLNRRLARALPNSYEELSAYRTDRAELLQDYAGRTTYPGYDDYSDEDDDNARRRKQIVNLTQQAAEAFTMNLAANRPRFLVTSHYGDFDAFANRMGRALDRYAKKLHLEECLQAVARDSFFTLGIAKVYQADSLAVGIEADYRMDPGKPFVQRISFDRFVYDTTATCFEESAFFGDVYSVPFEQATRDKRFSASVRSLIRELGVGSRRQTQTTAETLATDDNDEPLEDVIYLADVYIRSRRAVWTYIVDKDFNLRHESPIQRVKWRGEECGPYYFLNMGPIPDHVMPSSPGQNGRLLVQLINTLYRKLEDQARRQKQFFAGLAGREKDLEMAGSTKDGGIAIFDEKDSVWPLRFDGPDQNLFGFMLNAINQHSSINNNLKSQLGLGASADTFGQEQMIGAAVSKMGGFYQGRFVAFVRRLACGLARLLWEDTALDVPGKFEIPGGGVTVDDTWQNAGTDGARLGDFPIYEVDIDPYDMPYRAPSERMQMVQQEFQRMTPLIPWLAQVGVQPDMREYFDVLATYGTPEFRRIFKTNQPPMTPQGGEAPTISAGGPHEYMHHSSGGAGKDPDAAAMAMMSSQQEGE